MPGGLPRSRAPSSSSSQDEARGWTHLGGCMLAAPKTWAGVRPLGVGAVVDIVPEVVGRIGGRGREAGDEGAGEPGAATLRQAGLAHALDSAIAPGPAGADGRVVHAGAVEHRHHGGHHPRPAPVRSTQPPAAAGRGERRPVVRRDCTVASVGRPAVFPRSESAVVQQARPVLSHPVGPGQRQANVSLDPDSRQRRPQPGGC